jgi:peroxiredoxin
MQKTLSRKTLTWLARAGLLVLGLGLLWAAEEAPPGIRVGTQAPEFTLKDPQGKTYKLQDYRGKKVVLLDFGRFTCQPCRNVVQDLEKLHQKYKDQGVQIFSVNLDGPLAARVVPKGIEEFKLTFPVLLDTDYKVAQSYKVEVIPFLVLIDLQGVVRYTHLGYDRQLQKLLSDQFERYRPKKGKK